MNKVIKLVFLLFITSCTAQKEIFDYTDKSDINYILSSMRKPLKVNQSLFDDAYFLSVFEMDDSKVSINNQNESDEIYSSVFVSITPDGDYYTSSKLYKIEKLRSPKLLSIVEKDFFKIEIFIEHGNINSRQKSKFIINCN